MSIRISIVGAGLVGTRHLQALASSPVAKLASIVEPTSAGARLAQQYGVVHYRSLVEMLAQDRPDGIILATPNQAHVSGALECIAAGIPTLIEKPLANDVAGAQTIVSAAQAAGVQLLTGHHRRHNPLIERARAIIDADELGTISAVHGMTWLYKPDDYFNVEWRTKKGAGPLYINLIHDVDMLRHLCGEIISVFAMESNAIRGNEVEDTLVVTLRFANQALGTMSVSDTIVAPWSWELTARENPAYTNTPETCYQIGGSKGSLSLPNLALWSNPDQNSWWEPISSTRFPFAFDDPLVKQIRQFAAVIRNEEEPLVSAEEGLKNLQVLDAIKQSASSAKVVELPE